MIRMVGRGASRGGVVLALVALLVTAVAVPAPALAATTQCGANGGEEFLDTTIRGNLNVPDGAVCYLERTTVTGNVTVGTGAILLAFESVIGGSLRGTGYDEVMLDSGRVNGSVVLTDGAGTADLELMRIGGQVQITGSTAGCGCFAAISVLTSVIGGALTVADNAIAESRIIGNSVGGNLRFVANRTDGGDNEVSDNIVQGVLSCADNTPDPTGAGNTASRKTGECTTL